MVAECALSRLLPARQARNAMRIIGGTLKGRRLATVRGDAIRPTSDRLRETLFNIIASRVPGSSLLDLCAGTGAIGIEALSRGAAEVTFVDVSKRAIALIRSNLELCRIESEVRLLNRKATTAISSFASAGRQFDLVYLDLPYESAIHDSVLIALAGENILAPAAIVIIEHQRRKTLKPRYLSLQRFRQVRQGDSLLSFYTLDQAVEGAEEPLRP